MNHHTQTAQAAHAAVNGIHASTLLDAGEHHPLVAPAPAQSAAPPYRAGAIHDLSPKTLAEAMQLAEMLAQSDFVPKDYRGKPGNCMIAIQWGNEIGLKPLQAMQNIAVINGRPSLWGDAVLALVISSPVCVDVIEYYEGEGANRTAVCVAKRANRIDKVATFSVRDAHIAGLMDKDLYKKYLDRMLKMRARAFALRDQFADLLKGIPVAEELMGIQPDDSPGSHLDTPAHPGRPRQAKGSDIAAANRPPLSEEAAADIVRLTSIAKKDGYSAMKAEWQKLPPEIRVQIGTEKRDEIGRIGVDTDAKRKGDAEDAEVIS